MPATTARFVSLLSFASACTTATPSPTDTTPRDPLVVVEPGPAERREVAEGSGPLQILVGEQLREPTSFFPSREVGMTDEPQRVGWSAVTGEFVICVPGGGADCDVCEFHRRGAPSERIGVGQDCDEGRVSQRDLDARLAHGNFRIEDGAWAYGDDLVLVVAERSGAPDVDGFTRGIVDVGVRRRADDAPVVWLEQIEFCYDEFCAPDVHIDAIAPSPDGRTIAVLVHTFMGEYSDTYPLLLLDVEALATAAKP